jgi:hypothetical protein
MSFIENLQAKRQKFLDGLNANKGEINLDIFEDFYPDKAHFVFELLQNAEDTGATECKFTLASDSLEFRHNGIRKFDEADISSITGIHNSTKTKAFDSIGKFGVGFKSVFIYTLTPEIHSGPYSFRIAHLVMPELINPIPDLGDHTVFRMPFNNPEKKGAEEAFEEIRDGLEKLSELTLLFLNHIRSISWQIEGQEEGGLFRNEITTHHVEVAREEHGKTVSKYDFLRFSEPVRGHESQHVAVAFPLSIVSEQELSIVTPELHQRFRISPANPGRVSVFFPAEKETSGLRFHIHAPFVPTLDRSSVKNTDSNEPLFKQLGFFVADCLHRIRDLNLLSIDFLGVLPNPQDNLPPRYQFIRECIVNEMDSRDLTPTASGGFSAARRLVQAKANLKDLLTIADLNTILPGKLGKSREWAVAANQRNSNIERFLSSLDITEWGIDPFVKWLLTHFSISHLKFRVDGKGDADDWLLSKPPEWLQKFYALLFREGILDRYSIDLVSARLVRLSIGKLGIAKDCFFPSEDGAANMSIRWADSECYSFGQNQNEQRDAVSFLSGIGVRKLGEREKIEMILRNRYTGIRAKPQVDDMKFFLGYYESSPNDLSLFSGKELFLGSDDQWVEASDLHIDEPFRATGMRRFYQLRGGKTKAGISHQYLKLGISAERLGRFAEALGAITRPEILEIKCNKNPNWDYLKSVEGQNFTNPVDRDYTIYGFEQVFEKCDEFLSKIVWEILHYTKDFDRFLVAEYQKSKKYGSRKYPSLLAYQLKRTAWVPQEGMDPVAPPFADSRLLPPGFRFDRAAKWVEAVEFGEQLAFRVQAKQKENAILRESLGVDNDQSLDDLRKLAQIFARMNPDQRRECLENVERQTSGELPDNTPKNEELRRGRVGEEAKSAPEKSSEIRNRSVSVGREEVKAAASEYLRGQYTNRDGRMICQICQAVVPFQRLDGSDYFETVEFAEKLAQRHRQNYLALCPNHAAMFKYANASKEKMAEIFSTMGSSRMMNVDLAGRMHSIYFTETHRVDFEAVLAAESNPEISPR